MRRNGFSLVELSISLVIIGLLVGGVMTGSSMIRASEVKTVITEFQEYKQAALSFRTKYAGLPGDLIDATNYWTGETNGNGNGMLNSAAGVGLTGEFAQFWRHLALAGIIEGQYTGLAGPGGITHIVVGTASPTSAMANSGWGAWHLANYVGDATNYQFDYGNLLTFGAASTDNWNYGSVLQPEEAWNLDMKMDDGMPGTGKLITSNWPQCSLAAANNDYAAAYRLSNSNKNCALIFPNTFND